MTHMKVKRLSIYALVAALAGCATAPPPRDPNAQQAVKITNGPVKMPSGVSLRRLDLVKEQRLLRVYTQMVGIGDEPNSKVYFPPAVAKNVDLTNRQMNRRLEDMIQAAHRFQVFDDSTTVVRGEAVQTFDGQQMDIIIDAQVVDSTQEVIDISPYRKVQTTVRLSVQMKDVVTGELLFPSAVSVEGQYGMTQGEGAMLAPGVDMKSADFETKMANDYKRALDKAMQLAVVRINKVLKPMGRLTAVDPRSQTIDMLGGSRHGFQADDNVVIFHAKIGSLDGKRTLLQTQAVAVAHCTGVGETQTECDLTRIDPRFLPITPDDYAVLSDTADIREE
jgi:hypothetical protein